MGWIDIIYAQYKEWKKEDIIHVSPLQAIENEAIYKKLKNEGNEFCWAKETSAQRKLADGWKVVEEKNITGKKVFMDKNEELLLLYHKKLEN